MKDKYSCPDGTCGAPDCIRCRGLAAMQYRLDRYDDYYEPEPDIMLEAKEAKDER